VTARTDIARQAYRAYETRDRTLIESVLANDFTFSSPRDDHIDRIAYFARCWPNSDKMRKFTFELIAEHGDEVVVRYLLELTDGTRFRNMEVLHFSANKIAAVDVYFGRTIEQD
jgi:ketosteroid isomerase-like protein